MTLYGSFVELISVLLFNEFMLSHTSHEADVQVENLEIRQSKYFYSVITE